MTSIYNMTNRQPDGLPIGHVIRISFFLLYNIHLLDEAVAAAELVDDEEYVADVDVDAALQVVVEVYVAAE